MLQRSRKALLTMQTAGRYYTPQKNVQKLQQSRPSMGAVTQKRDFSMASG
jgi:hypothetical protein